MILKHDDLHNSNEQKLWHILNHILCRLNCFHSYFTNVSFLYTIQLFVKSQSDETIIVIRVNLIQ